MVIGKRDFGMKELVLSFKFQVGNGVAAHLPDEPPIANGLSNFARWRASMRKSSLCEINSVRLFVCSPQAFFLWAAAWLSRPHPQRQNRLQPPSHRPPPPSPRQHLRARLSSP